MQSHEQKEPQLAVHVGPKTLFSFLCNKEKIFVNQGGMAVQRPSAVLLLQRRKTGFSKAESRRVSSKTQSLRHFGFITVIPVAFALQTVQLH